MNAHRITLLILFALCISILSAGCGGGEKARLKEIGERISFEYHAQLRITKNEDNQLVLRTSELFDFAKRPSEGNEIIGIKFDDTGKRFEVIGTDNFRYVKDEGDTFPRIMLGEEQEFLENQAGRFRISFTSEKVLEGKSSGLFRREFSFEPMEVWPLVADAKNPDGYTAIERNEPDYGDIKLDTTAVFGSKRPPGGSFSQDRQSMVYSYPSDLAKLSILTFSYFPSRFGYYVGTGLMWIINRLAWMILGVVLYVWWINNRKKMARKRAEGKLRPKKKEEMKPRPPAKNTGGNKP